MKRYQTAAVFALVFPALLCSCAEKNLFARDSFSHFGSQTRWVYPVGSEGTEEVWSQILALEEQIEESVSTERAGSSVSRFNAAEAGAKVEIDETAYNILNTARKVYDDTQGAYDPSVGLLVDLWGFNPRFRAADYLPSMPYDRADYAFELPQEEYISAFRSLCDFSAVRLTVEEGKYYAYKPDVSVEVDGVCYTMQLNLSGVGKGYCVDRATALLREAGFTQGYFNLGGSSMHVFENPFTDSGEWEIGVVHPRAAGDYMNVPLKDVSLSTSGDYEQYYELGGRHYCHIIDPATGYPAGAEPKGDGSKIVCASVFGLPAAEGDATTTALVVMGKDRAIEYIREKLSSYDAAFVYYDAGENAYSVYTNSDRFTLLEDWTAVKI